MDPADTTRLIPEHEGSEVDVRIQVAHPVNVLIQTVEIYRTPGMVTLLGSRDVVLHVKLLVGIPSEVARVTRPW